MKFKGMFPLLTEKRAGSSWRKVFQLRDSTVRDDKSLFTACVYADVIYLLHRKTFAKIKIAVCMILIMV